ncbi:MAG TPA: SDR family NAD(P)-dependent oxidoreductase [Gemmatimonas sp.]|nr:SDR family NAD(P)-dependent oxidoreductase [Gemmatimonas sp.]
MRKSMLVPLTLLIASFVSGVDAQPAPRDPKAPVILITGSTDGLGREVARRLAATGAHVIVHGRNVERGAAVVDEITRSGKGSAAFYPADLGSLANVRAFADTILRHYPRISVLVNNAGVWLREGPRQTSADGYEMTFAVNYLSGYLLTRLLLPRMMASAPSRIINVASQTQSPVTLDDVMGEHGYSGQRAYSQSKLAQVMFTFDLARELDGKRVTVVALHPATLMDTHLVHAAGVQPRSTVDEGATALVRLVVDSGITHGAFYNGLRESRAHPQAYDDSVRAGLRTLSERLVARRR